MSNVPSTPEGHYAEVAGDADARLDEQLMILRHRSDAGEITAVEAAQLRVDLLEAHLATLKMLRRVYFGEQEAGTDCTGCSD